MSYRAAPPGFPDSDNPDGSDYGAVWNIPELMDCSAWKVYQIDEYGRLSFTPVDPTIQGPELNWLNLSRGGGDENTLCCH